jgi:predicted nucleic acid-binding protein
VQVLADFNAGIVRGQVATCDMVKLELLWSAQDHGDFVALRRELDDLPAVPIEPPVWDRAITVLESIAARGPLHHRRMRIPDLLIAAAAEFAGMPVCHYDRDFELIAEVTGQPVRAIAPLGSL